MPLSSHADEQAGPPLDNPLLGAMYGLQLFPRQARRFTHEHHENVD